ncbi:hypothetical protein A3Q56_04487 [Intoshia linei]|uniref:Small ribosomal subunit protein uS10 domain-containing protein n=1 Tax=Intoshia linei TaxID=1819745 RepID=A0A177B2F2_9BILA|nr:hypothetical protein A3Q56_04487 [Intoshia linei]
MHKLRLSICHNISRLPILYGSSARFYSKLRSDAPIYTNIKTEENAEIYTPPYLKYKEKIPYYQVVTVSVASMDFAILENYFKFMKSLTNRMELDTKSYPLPGISEKVTNLGNISESYELTTYKRNIKIFNILTYSITHLISLLTKFLPETVNMKVFYKDLDEAERYVPNVLVNDLQKKIDGINTLQSNRR